MLAEPTTLSILNETGAMHEGHYRLPDGTHTNLYFQMTQAHGGFNNWRRLCVGLSRVLRQAKELAPLLPDHVTMVSPSGGGLAVGFGVRDVLPVDQMVWAERDADGKAFHFRQFASIQKGEKCLVVDDILLTGTTVTKLIKLIQDNGGTVAGIAVLVDARTRPVDFGNVPFYSLVKIPRESFPDGKNCRFCAEGTPLVEAEF
jgi:orotate phosphoribosyltransferase